MHHALNGGEFLVRETGDAFDRAARIERDAPAFIVQRRDHDGTAQPEPESKSKYNRRRDSEPTTRRRTGPGCRLHGGNREGLQFSNVARALRTFEISRPARGLAVVGKYYAVPGQIATPDGLGYDLINPFAATPQDQNPPLFPLINLTGTTDATLFQYSDGVAAGSVELSLGSPASPTPEPSTGWMLGALVLAAALARNLSLRSSS